MNFGKAIEALKEGKKAARRGWNGKGMFIYLVRGSQVDRTSLRNEARDLFGGGVDDMVDICSHIDMRAADGSLVIGWLASQTDMLSDDWELDLR